MDGIHSRAIWDLQTKLIEFIEDGWKQPDDGHLGGPRPAAALHPFQGHGLGGRRPGGADDGGLARLDGPVDKWRALRDEIHAEVCEKGYNPDKQAFTQYYGSDQLDASLLMIPLVGFLPANDPRVVGTIEAIERDLTDDDGFVLRYRTTDAGAVDGLTGREGAFLACSFWLADCLHLIGRVDEATALFERLLGLRNDLGLLAEEYDAVAGRQVGNFPQAFSHVSLVNTAYRLTGQEPLTPGQAQVTNRMRRLMTENLIGGVGTGSIRATKWGLGGLTRHSLGTLHYSRPSSARKLEDDAGAPKRCPTARRGTTA